MTKAMMEYSAAEQLIPDNMEMKFWKAVRWQTMGICILHVKFYFMFAVMLTMVRIGEHC